METTRMEGNAISFFSKSLIDFKIESSLRFVGPNFNSFIHTACCDKWLFDTDVHSVDSTLVKRMHKIIIVDLIRGSLHINRHLVQLSEFIGENYCVFC